MSSALLRCLALALVAMPALVLAGCGDRWSWHEKITVEVETPHGVKVASSVVRKTLRHNSGWFNPPEARGASQSLSGEAVVLEVAPGKYLFALLKGLPNTFKVFFPGEAPVEVAGRLERLRERRKLSSDLYPLLVTFGDVTKPASVRRVEANNLAATFGSGYDLKAIRLEITDEPVTAGRLESVLGWLGPYPETPLIPKVALDDFSFAALRRQGEFIRR